MREIEVDEMRWNETLWDDDDGCVLCEFQKYHNPSVCKRTLLYFCAHHQPGATRFTRAIAKFHSGDSSSSSGGRSSDMGGGDMGGGGGNFFSGMLHAIEERLGTLSH